MDGVGTGAKAGREHGHTGSESRREWKDSIGVKGRTKNTPREGEVTETPTGERSVVWKRNQCRSQTYNKRPRLIEQR